MNRYKPIGWRNESYRHSLAAKGIRTSFAMRRSKSIDVLKLQKRFTTDEEVGVASRAEVKKVDRPIGKKSALLSEEEWLEGAITDLDTEIDFKQEGGTEEELEKLRNRRNELGVTLQAVKEKLGHLQSRPPTRKVKATEDIPLGLYDRYKGTSGRLPEAVQGILSGADLKMTELEKKAHYERMKKVGREDRAAKEVVRRLEQASEQKAVEEITDTESVQVTEDIVKPFKRGRKKNSLAAKHSFLFKVEEDPSYKRLRINRGYKEIVVVDAKKLKERFEKDHKTPLVWRQLRFDLLKDLDKFDKHPELDVLTSGKIDFNDGRHRVAVAASKGETIEVAVRNKQKFIASLGEQPPSNP